MALHLHIAPRQARVTAHEGLKLDVRLFNDGPSALTIPGPYDLTAALSLDFYGPDGRRVRRMNGLTRQALMTTGRIDPRPDLDVLEPGEEWRFTRDLSAYHLPLPAGRFVIEAVYTYPPADVALHSEKQEIEVVAPPIETVTFQHDNPVLDGLTLLMRVPDGGRGEFFLRQHNYGRPIAAWYSEGLESLSATGPAFCADAFFFQSESFEPFFRRWVVWTDDAMIHARAFESGQSNGPVRSARLPAGLSVVRSAYYTRDDALHVFFLAPDGTLSCHRLDEQGLEQVFTHSVGRSTEVIVAAGQGRIHVVSLRGGIVYERLGPDGSLEDSRRLFDTRLSCFNCEMDAVAGQVRAIFTDGRRGRRVEMVAASFDGVELYRHVIDRLPLRGEPVEMSFGLDRKHRFHLLATTDRKRLYYFREGQAPVRMAQGAPRFFPRVVAPRAVYLGFYRPGRSYRFVRARWHGPGRRIEDFEGE